MADGQLYRVRVNGQLVQVRADSEEAARQRAQQAVGGEGRAQRFEAARSATYDLAQGAADAARQVPAVGPLVSRAIRAGGELAAGDRSRSALQGSQATGAQGLAFGASDEIEGGFAAASAPFRQALGDPMGPGQAFQRQSSASRDEISRMRQEQPVTAFASEAIGAILNPASQAGGSFVLRGTNMVGRGGRAAVVGAPAGATYGALAAEGGAQDRAVGAGVGAATGAVAGGTGSIALEGLARTSGAAINSFGPALANAWSKISGGQGAQSLTRAQRRAWAHVRRRLADAGMDSEQVEAQMNRWAQTDYAPDFVFELSPQLTDDAAMLGRNPANRPAQAGRQAVNERQQGTVGRVGEAAREGLGDDGTQFTQTQQRLQSEMQAEEGPLWDAFRQSRPINRASNPEAHSTFTNLLRSSPRMKRASRRVLSSLQERGQVDPVLARALREASSGNTEILEGIDVPPAVLDQYRRELRSLAQRAYNSGDSEAGNAASQPLLRVRQILEDQYPDFNAAIGRSAELRSDIDALEIGYDLIRDTGSRRFPENVSAFVEGLTPNQLNLLRRGLARGIIEKAREAPQGGVQAGGDFLDFGNPANPVSRFFSRPDQQELIRAAFGDEGRFQRFAQRMQREFQRSENAAVGRFTLDNRQEDIIARNQGGGLASEALELAETAQGNPIPLVGRLLRAAGSEDPAEFEAELARILFSQATGPNANAQTRQMIARQLREETVKRLVESGASRAAVNIAQGNASALSGRTARFLTEEERPN